MLSLPPPRSKMRTLLVGDRIAHWQMQEASGTTVAEVGAVSNLTSTAAIVDGPFGVTTALKGRTFGTAGVAATGASTAGQRSALVGARLTFEAWVKSTSLAAAQTIGGHVGGGGGTSAENALMLVIVLTTGAVRVLWEQGSGTNVTSTTAAGVVQANRLHHIGVIVQPGSTSGRFIAVEVDGVVVGTFDNVAVPTGGGSGAWVIGAGRTDTDRFVGDIYEVRVSAVAVAQSAVRESYARGIRQHDLLAAIDSNTHTVHTRVSVAGGDGALIDVTNYAGHNFVRELSWGEDVNGQCVTADLVLASKSAELSVSPYLATRYPNVSDALGVAVDVKRRVLIEVSIQPCGTPREAVGEDWHLAFDGFATAFSVDDGGKVVNLTLADIMHPLQAAWVQPDRTPTPPQDRTYGSAAGTPVEPELQAIITNNAPTGGYLGGVTPTLYTPTSPSFNVFSWTVMSNKNVASAVVDPIAQIGWQLRPRFDSLRYEHRITLYDPDRSKTWSASDRTLTASTLRVVRRFEVKSEDIRNDVEVEYADAGSTDAAGQWPRTIVRVQDATSIARYGRLYARVGFSSTGNVNTSAEATRLATAMVNDLAEPYAEMEVEVPFRYDLQLDDVVKCLANDVVFDADVVFAVVGYRNRLSARGATTTLTLRSQRPVGRTDRWWEMVQAAGNGRASSTTPPPAPTGLGISLGVNAIAVGHLWPVNNLMRAFDAVEVHMSSSTGFTPSAATLQQVLRGTAATLIAINDLTTRFFRFVRRDRMGNRSDASPQISGVARCLPVAPNSHATRATTDQAVASSPATVVFNSQTTGTDVLGNYAASTGIWTAPVDGLVNVAASVLFDSDAKASAEAFLEVWVDNTTRVLVGATLLTNSGAAPNRCVVTVAGTVRLTTGQTMRIRIHHQGNAGSVVVNDDNLTWLSIAQVSQD